MTDTYRFNGKSKTPAHANERWHGRGRRQIDASIRADEATIRSCGYPHTDNGWAFVTALPYMHWEGHHKTHGSVRV